MKAFLATILLALLAGCTTKPTPSETLTPFIPDESMAVLKLHNPDLFFSNLKNNEFLKSNDAHPLVLDLKKEFSLFRYFPHKDPAYLALSYTPKGKLELAFISRGLWSLNIDSVQNKQVETLSTSEHIIKKYTLNGQIGYWSNMDSVSVFSNSKRLLESSLSRQGSIARSPDFRKAMKASTDGQPNVFLDHKKVHDLLERWFPDQNLDLLKNFGSWTQLDTDLTHEGIKLNGVITAGDTLSHYLSLFRGVGLADNLIGEVTPTEANGFYSVSFENYDPFHQNLLSFRKEKDTFVSKHFQDLLKTASEAGLIYLDQGKVLAIRTIDPEAARVALSAYQEETETFREVPIFEHPSEQSFTLLNPLLPKGHYNYFAYLADFILFSPDTDLLKQIIRAQQSKQVIIHHDGFQNVFRSLSSESSVLSVVNTSNFLSDFDEILAGDLPDAAADLSVDKFPIAALQLVYQGDFAHIHAVLTKTIKDRINDATSQTASVNIDAPLATPPAFFRNHRTKGLDIALQDRNNTLYLISPSGQIYWKKQLESRILGNIHSVDILRNGRYQMAFTTQSKLHVIDRTGKTVPPFPLNFQDEISQPLAVFDYDNNRNYRFVIVQNEEIFMFDNKGKRVRGFTFSKAADEIIKPPKHIRIGRKDYILVSENSGKLNILSRTGKTRVPVKEKLSFSEDPWFQHKDKFLSSDASGNLISIDQRGHISMETLENSNGTHIRATENLLVSRTENVLRINEKEINLDFGLYTAPKIFYVNNTHYIGLTDLQAHKVYLFDSDGNLLPGFPVYGSSTFDMGNADGDSRPELTVQGEDDNILLYDVHYNPD